MKGAFQLSLSFIVIVVFSVILLSLSIAFLQGIFPQISTLTHQVTDVARDELIDRISRGAERAGIAAPAVTTWKRGETGSFALGIRNINTDRDVTYSINIYLEVVGGELAGMNASIFAVEARKWLTVSPNEFVPASSAKTSDIIIRPSITADPGIYKFRAIVCDTPIAQQCVDLSSPTLYDSDQFTLEIKAT